MTENEAIKILTLDEHNKQLLTHLAPVYETAIQALEAIQAYRAIGTVEELQVLKEKAEPKKPILRKDGTYDCVCGNAVIKTECYCEDCGQKLGWSEEE